MIFGEFFTALRDSFTVINGKGVLFMHQDGSATQITFSSKFEVEPITTSGADFASYISMSISFLRKLYEFLEPSKMSNGKDINKVFETILEELAENIVAALLKTSSGIRFLKKLIQAYSNQQPPKREFDLLMNSVMSYVIINKIKL
ncbi:MAG: hypothetical protein QXP36_00165 [Conexivisphaerales archaeon]